MSMDKDTAPILTSKPMPTDLRLTSKPMPTDILHMSNQQCWFICHYI